MKKIILSNILLIGLSFCVNAQEISENALGLRFGSNNGFGAEVSYQRALSNNNRVELDLGWRNSDQISAIKLVGLYQWVWNIEGNFNWYAGVGGGLGSWNQSFDKTNGSFAFATGDIGVEYHFDIPLMVSLDLRPEFGGNGYFKNNYGSDIALGFKYKF